MAGGWTNWDVVRVATCDHYDRAFALLHVCPKHNFDQYVHALLIAIFRHGKGYDCIPDLITDNSQHPFREFLQVLFAVKISTECPQLPWTVVSIPVMIVQIIWGNHILTVWLR